MNNLLKNPVKLRFKPINYTISHSVLTAVSLSQTHNKTALGSFSLVRTAQPPRQGKAIHLWGVPSSFCRKET
jgi:hypothetical protein